MQINQPPAAVLNMNIPLSIFRKVIMLKYWIKILKQPDSALVKGGWSGGAMVLGKLPVPGRLTIWITVGQGPIALAVGAGGGGLDIFTLIYPFSSFSLSLGDGPI